MTYLYIGTYVHTDTGLWNRKTISNIVEELGITMRNIDVININIGTGCLGMSNFRQFYV